MTSNMIHTASAINFKTENSLGHVRTLIMLVMILFKHPTNVNVVAVTRLRHFHPLYEIETPNTHDKETKKTECLERTGLMICSEPE